MSVSPLPTRGGLHGDPRGAGRVLRISAHPELGVVTLSMWRGASCVATHQVPVGDVPELIRMLANALVVETPPAVVAPAS